MSSPKTVGKWIKQAQKHNAMPPKRVNHGKEFKAVTKSLAVPKTKPPKGKKQIAAANARDVSRLP